MDKMHLWKFKERIKLDPDRYKKQDKLLSKLKNEYLKFLLIYDDPKYLDKTYEIYSKLPYNHEFIEATRSLIILYGYENVLEIVLKRILEGEFIYCNAYNFILRNTDKTVYEKMLNHQDNYIKYLTVCFLIKEGDYSISSLVDLCIKSSMDEKSLVNIANLLYKSNKKDYIKLETYIVSRFSNNELGIKLLSNPKYEITPLVYKTASDKLLLQKKYGYKLTKEMREEFKRKNPIQGIIDNEFGMDRVYKYRLGDKVEEYIDKYLKMSKDKVIEYLASGSSSDVYRIGDYVIKLSRRRWSYGDILCPNSYLIVKNYEEDTIRDENNLVAAQVEVQRYLSKEAPLEYVGPFLEALEKEGYYYYDYLTDGPYGSNLRLLDSYKDMDNVVIDKVPSWFFTHPVVLVDRDLVFKIGDERKALIVRKTIKR